MLYSAQVRVFVQLGVSAKVSAGVGLLEQIIGNKIKISKIQNVVIWAITLREMKACA